MRCGFSESFEVDMLKFSPTMNSPKGLKEKQPNNNQKLKLFNSAF